MYSNFEYKLQNTYVFGWESDFFCVATASKYVYEIEVKVSKSDFKADFQKIIFNQEPPYSRNIKKHDFILDKDSIFKPHKFFFACPEGLIQPSDIPKEYGLIWVVEKRKNYYEAFVKQNPKFLHKTNLFENKKFIKQMLSKYYHRYLEILKTLEKQQIDLKFNQKRLFEDCNF
jgi:hypothetical protein